MERKKTGRDTNSESRSRPGLRKEMSKDARKEMVELVTRRIGPLVLERLMRLGVPG